MTHSQHDARKGVAGIIRYLAMADQLCARQAERAAQLRGTRSGTLAASLLANFRAIAACLKSASSISELDTAIERGDVAAPPEAPAKKTARAGTGVRRYACEANGTCIVRSVCVEGHSVRLCLGPKMWSALKEIRGREGMTLNALMNLIARSYPGWPLESALGVYTLLYFMAAATEEGHRRAGHGSNATGYAEPDNSAPWFFPLLSDPSPGRPRSAVDRGPDC